MGNEGVHSIQNSRGFTMYLTACTQDLGIYLVVASQWTRCARGRRNKEEAIYLVPDLSREP
jgi:hypothetical protein